MRVALLVLLLVLPVVDASPVMRPPVVGYFEFDQTAVLPPGVLEGVLVLESTQAMVVEGTVFLDHGTPRLIHDARTEDPPERQALLHVEEDMEAYDIRRIPFTVPVEEIGIVRILFDSGGRVEPMGRMDQVVGLAPVDVSAGPAGNLVSVPGRPAELTVTVTALPGSMLTDLRLSGPRITDVEVGDLPAGESQTVVLRVEAEEGHRGFSGVDRSALDIAVSGAVDGKNFTHPLYQTVDGGFEAVRPTVYVASSSTAFILPPDEARLNTSTVVQVAVLNAGSSAVTMEGRLRLDLPGMPHLRTAFDVHQRVGPGQVETIDLEWTPPAAGDWGAELHHDVHAYGMDSNGIPVLGPIRQADLRLPPPLERGGQATLQIVLTASEDTDVEGLLLTSSQTPLKGLISISDLFRVGPVQAVGLVADNATTMEMQVTAKATGSHDLYLVVQTPDGPSVHNAGVLVVQGSDAELSLAWAPTLGLVMLLGVHVAWRRRWVR